MTLRRSEPPNPRDIDLRARSVDTPRSTCRVVSGACTLAAILGAVLLCAEAAPAQSDMERRLEALKAVPYVAWTEQKVDRNEQGVTVYDTLRAYDGYTLYVSKTRAALIDMRGNEVHSWGNPRLRRLEHVKMTPDGDIYVLLPREGIYRLNWGGDIVWSAEAQVHHDFDIEPDGDVIALAYDEVVMREFGPRPVLSDKLIRLHEDGSAEDVWRLSEHRHELSRWCSEEALTTISDDVPDDDWSHMNTVEIIDGGRASSPVGGAAPDERGVDPATGQTRAPSRHVAFRPGNMLICIRNLDFVGVVNPDTGEIVWGWGPGELDHPHQPSVLPNGDVLVFDNGFFRGWSRVVEYDPVDEEIVWEYQAPDPYDFYSRGRGSAQELPNGDVLITESAKGRVFEVTRAGEVVWNFLNPEMHGDRRGTLYRSFRYDSDAVEGLLESDGVHSP